MAILKIARMGHPVLFRRADPVADVSDPAIQRLIADMMETVEDAQGAGLAAPQVHVPLRLFVFRVPAERTGAGRAPTDAATADSTAGDAATGTGANDGERPLEALVNPVIEALDDEIVEDWEGCLSIPGLQARVPRLARIRYAGLDATGRPVAREATGFHARVVQHETDHLDGVLYPMRLRDFTAFGFSEEIGRRRAAEEDGP